MMDNLFYWTMMIFTAFVVLLLVGGVLAGHVWVLLILLPNVFNLVYWLPVAHKRLLVSKAELRKAMDQFK